MSPHLIVELLRLMEDRASAHQQSVTSRSELYTFGAANQQCGTETFLQIGEPFTDGRGHRVRSLAGPSDTAGFSDRNKNLQVS